MARVYHVKKARKARPDHGIAVGDEYWWWQFYRSAPRYSKRCPEPWESIGSAFLSNAMQVSILAERAVDAAVDAADVKSIAAELLLDYETMQDECQENLDNMPEGLQSAPSGEILQGRIDELEERIQQLGEIDSLDADECGEDETLLELCQERMVDCFYQGE